MRWGSFVYARLPTSSVSLRLTASPHRGSLWGAQPQASPFRGGGSAQPRRRGRFEFVTTSQSAFGCQLPCKGSLWPAAAGSPLRHSGSAPLDKGSLGACKFIKPPRKKVQSDKLRLHLLFAANIQRQRLIKLIPTYQAARTKTPVRCLSCGTTSETLALG